VSAIQHGVKHTLSWTGRNLALGGTGTDTT